jgi:hypothetical protein
MIRICISWGGKESHPAGRWHQKPLRAIIPECRTALKKLPPLTQGDVFFVDKAS